MDSNYAVIKDGILQKFITTLTDNMYYDQNGYLVCTDAVLGRTGSQEYTKRELGIDNSNDIIEVYRLEEYVFDEFSALATIYVPSKKAGYYKKRLPEQLHDKIVELQPEKKTKK